MEQDLSKLKNQYEKLGKEIKDLEKQLDDQEWLKVLSPKWCIDAEHVSYEIQYVQTKHRPINSVVIQIYNSKEDMINWVRNEMRM
jgi:formate-dependent nitrite reductase cytochrome c552 subunit